MRHLIFTFTLLLSITSFAQKTTVTVSDGAWNDPAIWSAGVPVSGDDVYVYHIVAKTGDWDIGNGSLSVEGDLNIFGDVDVSSSGHLEVLNLGVLQIHGDFLCDGCDFYNFNDIYVDGDMEFTSNSSFYNSCKLGLNGTIEFRGNMTVAYVYEGASIIADDDIRTKTTLHVNGGTLNAGDDIKVITQNGNNGTIVGYGGNLIAYDEIVNDGTIIGIPTDYHYLEDDDCTVGGSGTESYVTVCSILNAITECDPGASLPVNLASIQAAVQLDGSVSVTWKVATEEDFSHYEIERSYSNTWEKIGTVNSKYNGLAGGGSYEHTDNPKATGEIYYRLKMVDLDGTFEYSPVASVKVELLTGDISVYPNPVNGEVLNLKGSIDKFNNIRITDISGRILKTIALIGDEGGQILLEVADLPTGLYLMEIEGTNGSVTKRFVKN